MGRSKKGAAKRWWIKLEYSFFQDKMIKAMRRKLGDNGDKALVIYIKILTRFLASDFTIAYEGYEDSLAEEVASDIDEENNVEIIEELFDFLKKHELMIQIEGDKEAYYFPQAAEMSGSETPDAERKRIERAIAKEKKDCPDIVGHCPVIEPEQSNSQNQSYSQNKSYSSDSEQSKAEQTSSAGLVGFDSEVEPVGGQAKAAAVSTGGLVVNGHLNTDKLYEIREKKKIKLSDTGIQAFIDECEIREDGVYMWGKKCEDIGASMNGFRKHRIDEHPEYHEEEPWLEKEKGVDAKYIEDFTDEELDNKTLFPGVPEYIDDFFNNELITYGAYKEWFGVGNEEFLKDIVPYTTRKTGDVEGCLHSLVTLNTNRTENIWKACDRKWKSLGLDDNNNTKEHYKYLQFFYEKAKEAGDLSDMEEKYLEWILRRKLFDLVELLFDL